MPKLSEIDFVGFKSYHEIPLHDIDWSEAESRLTDERRKYLRTTAKEKAGQAAGAGALSSVAKNVYSRLVKQAVSTLLSRSPPLGSSHAMLYQLLPCRLAGCEAVVEGEA
jgi:hypothetical protein